LFQISIITKKGEKDMEKIDYSLFEGHTEGPWRVVNPSIQFTNTLTSKSIMPKGAWLEIAQLVRPYDANLIAAAPALLDRCRDLEEENKNLREENTEMMIELNLRDDPSTDSPLLPHEEIK
jgi:hypothetical protein